METAQIATELRELSDRLDRLETYDEDHRAALTLMTERTIPALTKDFRHTLGGTDILVANLAGTVEALAVTLGTVADRMTLLERHFE